MGDRSSTGNGIQYWAEERICGRGVLLDHASYAARHEIAYSSFSLHRIPLNVLLDVAREQTNLQFRRDDILFIRIRLVHEWEQVYTIERKMQYAKSKNPQHAGIEGTEEMLRWIWDSGFSALAGDSVSFEVYPNQPMYAREGGDRVPGLFMHAGWGMPMGELFDLERLSMMCKEEDRLDVFISSAPLNMPVGVSSPPNFIAFF